MLEMFEHKHGFAPITLLTSRFYISRWIPFDVKRSAFNYLHFIITTFGPHFVSSRGQLFGDQSE
jgi:hypothetical protein